MIAFVEGRVVSIGGDSAVLDTGGLGYRVFCGPGTLAGLREGTSVRLLTHHLVREDVQALYGFATREELGFFELLITVSGVGPKVALAIVASRPVTELQLAIFQGDEALLTAVSGVGKKLAGRVILELKEKVSVAGVAAGEAAGRGAPGAAESEVVAALQALGYSAGEAREAARGAVAALPAGASLEERVKGALRALRRE